MCEGLLQGKGHWEGFLESVTPESQRMSRSQLIQGVDGGNTDGHHWKYVNGCWRVRWDGVGCVNVRAGVRQG